MIIAREGFELEIEDANLDNWEVLEVIDELEEHPERAVRLARMILGEKAYRMLKEHCRDDSGKVSMEKMMAALEEILSGDSVKNL